jgi:ketosteroid isomerase-like protein
MAGEHNVVARVSFGAMEEARQAVDAHVAALNHGDLQAVLDTFTEDAVFSSDGGRAEGRAELAGLFDSVVGESRPTTILRSAAVEGVALRCLMTRRFSVRDEEGRVAASHDVEVHAVFTVADGLIARVDVDPIL